MSKRDYYRNLIKEAEANKLTKYEKEVIECLCNRELKRTENFICEDMDGLTYDRLQMTNILEKVRKM